MSRCRRARCYAVCFQILLEFVIFSRLFLYRCEFALEIGKAKKENDRKLRGVKIYGEANHDVPVQ